jgi:hypothetical protein|tara:strand:+ start:235 stop:1116 length:882 start_codon:yes stop_codon:yes gene_type:complete
MKRVIYTVFMNHFEVGNDLRKYDPTFNLTEYFPMLARKQMEYAEICQADYKIFGYGDRFQDYVLDLMTKGIFETSYQAIQHYKFYCAEQLKNDYDEILYLDLDVYPNTEQNIFEKIKADRGIATHGFHDDKEENIVLLHTGQLNYEPMERSVCVKHALMQALCMKKGIHSRLDIVANTGIMLFNPSDIEKLNYTASLNWVIPEINQIKEEGTNFYKDYIERHFNNNNESIFSYLVSAYQLNHQQLGEQWHWVWNHRNANQMPDRKAKLIHVINKQFGTLNGLAIQDLYSLINR